MGRQIARSADVVFCLTFAQLDSIGDERNVSEGGREGQSVYDVRKIFSNFIEHLLNLSLQNRYCYIDKFKVICSQIRGILCGRHICGRPPKPQSSAYLRTALRTRCFRAGSPVEGERVRRYA